ncbi:hypothetical protein Bca101_088144 [Brassica carinata]
MEPKRNASISSDHKTNKKTVASSATAKPNGKSTASSRYKTEARIIIKSNQQGTQHQPSAYVHDDNKKLLFNWLHTLRSEEKKIIDEVMEINDQTVKSHNMDEEEEVSIEDVPDVKEESAVLEKGLYMHLYSMFYNGVLKRLEDVADAYKAIELELTLAIAYFSNGKRLSSYMTRKGGWIAQGFFNE